MAHCLAIGISRITQDGNVLDDSNAIFFVGGERKMNGGRDRARGGGRGNGRGRGRGGSSTAATAVASDDGDDEDDGDDDKASPTVVQFRLSLPSEQVVKALGKSLNDGLHLDTEFLQNDKNRAWLESALAEKQHPDDYFLVKPQMVGVPLSCETPSSFLSTRELLQKDAAIFKLKLSEYVRSLVTSAIVQYRSGHPRDPRLLRVFAELSVLSRKLSSRVPCPIPAQRWLQDPQLRDRRPAPEQIVQQLSEERQLTLANKFGLALMVAEDELTQSLCAHVGGVAATRDSLWLAHQTLKTNRKSKSKKSKPQSLPYITFGFDPLAPKWYGPASAAAPPPAAKASSSDNKDVEKRRSYADATAVGEGRGRGFVEIFATADGEGRGRGFGRARGRGRGRRGGQTDAASDGAPTTIAFGVAPEWKLQRAAKRAEERQLMEAQWLSAPATEYSSSAGGQLVLRDKATHLTARFKVGTFLEQVLDRTKAASRFNSFLDALPTVPDRESAYSDWEQQINRVLDMSGNNDLQPEQKPDLAASFGMGLFLSKLFPPSTHQSGAICENATVVSLMLHYSEELMWMVGKSLMEYAFHIALTNPHIDAVMAAYMARMPFPSIPNAAQSDQYDQLAPSIWSKIEKFRASNQHEYRALSHHSLPPERTPPGTTQKGRKGAPPPIIELDAQTKACLQNTRNRMLGCREQVWKSMPQLIDMNHPVGKQLGLAVSTQPYFVHKQALTRSLAKAVTELGKAQKHVRYWNSRQKSAKHAPSPVKDPTAVIVAPQSQKHNRLAFMAALKEERLPSLRVGEWIVFGVRGNKPPAILYRFEPGTDKQTVFAVCSDDDFRLLYPKGGLHPRSSRKQKRQLKAQLNQELAPTTAVDVAVKAEVLAKERVTYLQSQMDVLMSSSPSFSSAGAVAEERCSWCNIAVKVPLNRKLRKKRLPNSAAKKKVDTTAAIKRAADVDHKTATTAKTVIKSKRAPENRLFAVPNSGGAKLCPDCLRLVSSARELTNANKNASTMVLTTPIHSADTLVWNVSEVAKQLSRPWMKPESMRRPIRSIRFGDIDVWTRAHYFTGTDGNIGERMLREYNETLNGLQMELSGKGIYVIAARDRAECRHCDGCKTIAICQHNWYPAYLDIRNTSYEGVSEKVVVVTFPGYAPNAANQQNEFYLLKRLVAQDPILLRDVNIRIFRWKEIRQLANQIGRIREKL